MQKILSNWTFEMCLVFSSKTYAFELFWEISDKIRNFSENSKEQKEFFLENFLLLFEILKISKIFRKFSWKFSWNSGANRLFRQSASRLCLFVGVKEFQKIFPLEKFPEKWSWKAFFLAISSGNCLSGWNSVIFPTENHRFSTWPVR